MPTERRCEKCGAVLAAFGPAALCPNCMLREAIRLGADLTAQPAAAGPGKGAAVVTTPVTEKVGDRIGRYKLLQPIGEGGMGVVYMAEQEEPVRRRVALKVIKLGMDTKSVIARFEAERQALALMDHPNIAKVLDAGATDTGRPYFVMELVRGIRITDYCDQNHLATRQRLDLFTQICKAIQHAHQKGIIHRDIKPSNILVTLHDGVPVPKIIDFGIAKATSDQRLTDKTLFTAFEQFVGTPAYMSPEQAELSGLDIDTRSDIYSLGVLLYELLTGQTPFEAKELLAAGLDAMRRTIREKEPPKPSTRLSAMGMADTADVTNRFKMSPTKLAALVRGDLDWIVMKALEKDRARRYESANGLAMDIQRYLDNEPVVARPPSAAYRFQKLVRRNKIAVAATSAVVAALVIGMGVSTWLFLREKADRQRAVAAEQKAKTQAAKSKQVAQFLEEMLKGAGPSVALGEDTTLLKKILDKTAARIDIDLTNQPDVEADMRFTISEIYWQLGENEKAEALGRLALATAKRVWGKDHVNVACSLDYLGNILISAGKPAEAETLARDSLAIKTKLFGHEHPDVASSLYALGLVLQGQDKLAEAESMFRQAVDMNQKLLGSNHTHVAVSRHGLAGALADAGSLAAAETEEREALRVHKGLVGKDHPEVAKMLYSLSRILSDEDKLSEAEARQEEALEMQRKLLGGEHPNVAASLSNLGLVLQRQGRLVEAEKAQRNALAMQQRLTGSNNCGVSECLCKLALVLNERSEFAPAEAGLREALRIERRNHPEGDPDVGSVLALLAVTLELEHQLDQAEPLARECLAIREKRLPDNPHTFNSRSILGGILLGQGKTQEAGPLLATGYEGLRRWQENTPVGGKASLEEALVRLVRFSQAAGAADQVTRWQAEFVTRYGRTVDDHRPKPPCDRLEVGPSTFARRYTIIARPPLPGSFEL